MKEEDIAIINNYRDLPIGDYMDIVAISKDEGLEEVDKQVKIISILTGRSEADILDLPIQEYKSLAANLVFLSYPIPSEDVQRVADSYKIGKFELIPVIDIRKVTTAQYIDFQTFHQAGLEDHFAEILSCLLVPKGKKYNQGYDVLEVQDAIKRNLSVFDTMMLYGFFVVSCGESIRGMLTFSLQEAQTIKDKTKRTEMVQRIQEQMELLKANGAGFPM